jgi:hypothetical protein
MLVAALMMMASSALFFFYLEAVCQRLLNQPFTPEFYEGIVRISRLEFPLIRKGVEDFGSPGEYLRLRVALRTDFLAVTYLLKNASNIDRRYTSDDRLLILYFQLLYVSLVTRHVLRLPENPTVIKLTAILQYFANVVGQRINTFRFGSLTASNYPSSI